MLATLIVSPFASRVRDARVRRRITGAAVTAMKDRGAAEVQVVEAGEPATIRTASEAAVAAGAGLVVLAGGDGTVRDAAGPLAGAGIAVGIVPCGTGNLYATAIGLPRELDHAIAVLRTGIPSPHDVGVVRLIAPHDGMASPMLPLEPMSFVAACGTGLDARLIAATTRESKRRYGVAAYFLSASQLLRHLAPQPTVLTVDGVRTELESVVVLVANCGEPIPGHLRPRLPIEPDDGKLHVFVLPKGGIVGGIRGVLELMTAEAAGVSPSGAAIRLTGTHVRVEVVPAGPTQVDGDAYPASTLEAELRPGALEIIRPPRGRHR